MNYFELFGIKEAPVADKAAVSKRYFELQKQSHPDFFTNENELAKENALEQSASINKAYQIFRNAEKTIEYYLQLNGVIVPDEKYDLPPAFLGEMMELNESLEDDEPQVFREKVAVLEKELLSEIAPLVAEEREEPLTATEMQALKSWYYRQKYLKRILERLGD